MFIKTFDQLSKSDIKIAGGKGASLGEMIRLGIAVPPGFVIIAEAFERFLEETDIGIEVQAQFDKVNFDDPNSIDNCSRAIQGLIENYEMPEDLKKEIQRAYDDLGAEFVAVRSSATAEDSSVASFAGQLETFLYTNRLTLLENVKKCWASLVFSKGNFLPL